MSRPSTVFGRGIVGRSSLTADDLARWLDRTCRTDRDAAYAPERFVRFDARGQYERYSSGLSD